MSNIEVRTGDAPQVEAFLAERIYEYNAAATGYHDGESFTAICEVLERPDASNACALMVCVPFASVAVFRLAE